MTSAQQVLFDKFYGEALTLLIEKDPTLRGNPGRLHALAMVSAAMALAALDETAGA